MSKRGEYFYDNNKNFLQNAFIDELRKIDIEAVKKLMEIKVEKCKDKIRENRIEGLNVKYSGIIISGSKESEK